MRFLVQVLLHLNEANKIALACYVSDFSFTNFWFLSVANLEATKVSSLQKVLSYRYLFYVTLRWPHDHRILGLGHFRCLLHQSHSWNKSKVKTELSGVGMIENQILTYHDNTHTVQGQVCRQLLPSSVFTLNLDACRNAVAPG